MHACQQFDFFSKAVISFFLLILILSGKHFTFAVLCVNSTNYSYQYSEAVVSPDVIIIKLKVQLRAVLGFPVKYGFFLF